MSRFRGLKVDQERATKIDLCRVFQQEMDRLYALAYLLTADHKLAEECFVQALGECSSTARFVFQEWALTWSKRVVIKNAIRFLVSTSSEKAKSLSFVQLKSPLAKAILQLDQFSRSVMVMSVLEGYNKHDCCVLLDCTQQELVKARSGALRHLAGESTFTATL